MGPCGGTYRHNRLYVRILRPRRPKRGLHSPIVVQPSPYSFEQQWGRQGAPVAITVCKCGPYVHGGGSGDSILPLLANRPPTALANNGRLGHLGKESARRSSAVASPPGKESVRGGASPPPAGFPGIPSRGGLPAELRGLPRFGLGRPREGKVCPTRGRIVCHPQLTHCPARTDCIPASPCHTCSEPARRPRRGRGTAAWNPPLGGPTRSKNPGRS
jgi:hypothetical protein